MGLIDSIIAGLMARLVYDEATAWSPRLTRLMLRAAISLTPKAQRNTRNEEWTAWVNEVPGQMGKLLASAGFILAAQQGLGERIGLAASRTVSPLFDERSFFAGFTDAHDFLVSKAHGVIAIKPRGLRPPPGRLRLLRLRVSIVGNILVGNAPFHGLADITGRLLGIDLNNTLDEVIMSFDLDERFRPIIVTNLTRGMRAIPPPDQSG